MANALADPPPPKTAIPLPMEAIRAFCEKWGVVELALFGSVLREDFGPGSDVDVLYRLDPTAEAAPFDTFAMEDELTSIFGRPVDFVSRAAVESGENWYRRKSILNSSKVIYAR